MKKMIYLTYAEQPSGVYSSQVLDVIHYINQHAGGNLQLVAFISLHDFRKTKQQIKQQHGNAIVLPMLPKSQYWKFNIFQLWLVCLLLRPQTIIARNVLAANMALAVRSISTVKKIGFDGRGAIAAEWKEYDVTVPETWKNKIDQLEKNAVLNSDFRLAVSAELISYWRNRYNYTFNDHVVIPCTLNSGFTPPVMDDETISTTRKKLGYSDEDIILTYSGSAAGWQSFSILYDFLNYYLSKGVHYKALFLSPDDKNIQKLISVYPNQVSRKWVAHHDVPAALASGDYGILVREQSVTNQVASPTKFAEYLSSGLPVLISKGLGDYSSFTEKNDCGFIISENNYPELSRTSQQKRKQLLSIVQHYCTKDAYLSSYKKMISSL